MRTTSIIGHRQFGPAGVLLLLLAMLAPVNSYSVEPVFDTKTVEWNFRVYLDDSEIGYHRFQLTDTKESQKLVTEADFRVKFLFLTAYKYQHRNVETWRNDCLQAIESETDINGESFAVRGLQKPDVFAFEVGELETVVSDCVNTFAYWNADFLDKSRLLNSQTGELMPITVEPLPEENITVRGVTTTARKYRLLAEDLNLDLYSKDDEWLGLESTTKSGRKLRYELI